MVEYIPTVESWSDEEYIGGFRDLDDVTVFLLNGEEWDGKICGIGNDRLSIDINFPEGEYKDFSFNEIDYIEEFG